MAELIREGNLAIRLMRDAHEDYSAMARWLSDPRVLEFYDGRDHPLDLALAQEKYSPRILNGEGVTPCILELDESPIGYLQFYELRPETIADFATDPPPGTGPVFGSIFGPIFGIDQFIGEVENWNRGIGTLIVKLAVRYLAQEKGAHMIVLDPQASNGRAIRCYEKCGFKEVKVLAKHELHEGIYKDCWLMLATPNTKD